MKKMYCIKWSEQIKFKNPKKTYIFNKTLVFSVICSKSGNNIGTIFKEESIEILTIIGLIENINRLKYTVSRASNKCGRRKRKFKLQITKNR